MFGAFLFKKDKMQPIIKIFIFSLFFGYSRPVFPAKLNLKTSIPLTAHDCKHLQQLLKNDEEAKRFFDSIISQANTGLQEDAVPLMIINYEGLISSNPERIQTIKQLKQMESIQQLTYAYAATGKSNYAKKALSLSLAWVQAYVPTGNPINENKLTPMLTALPLLVNFANKNQQDIIKKWLVKLTDTSIKAGFQGERGNWRSKRIKIVALSNQLLADQQYQQFVADGVEDYINRNFFGDSTTIDLRHRDALSYHCGGLKPILSTLLAMGKKGQGYYSWENQEGGTIQKSVELLIPYMKKEKVYPQWVNSQVAFDRERWESGDDFYRPGRPWNPEGGVEVMKLAQFFDHQLNQYVKMYDSSGEKYSCIESVLLAVMKPAQGY